MRVATIDELKKRITQAMRERDEITKDVLRVALGEIQMIEAREGRAPTDDEALAVVRKLVKSNEETLTHAAGDAAAALRKEIVVLTALLPPTASVDDLVALLAPIRDAVRAAANDGQATGLAVKHLKAAGAVFQGTDAAAAVKRVRA